MKKTFALTALLLISSLNPHRAQAELAFTIPLIDVWSGTKKTYTTINNIYTFDPATTASILLITVAGALGAYACDYDPVVSGFIIGWLTATGIGIFRLHQASSIHDIETKFIQAIRRKDIAEVKQLCEKLLNARSIDHYDVAAYLEIAREEIEKITNKPTRIKLLAIINTCDRQNLIAHASARRI